jgi:DNA modification methylase
MNQIYNDNCLNVLPKFQDNTIDLIITSPPYDNLRDYNNISLWDFTVFKKIAMQLSRILRQGGVIVWIVNDSTINGSETGTSFNQALYFKEECGLNINDTMIWEKDTSPFGSENRYTQIFEYMFIFSKGKPKTINLIKDKKNKWVGNIPHGTDRMKDGTTRKKNIKKGNITLKFSQRTNIWKQNTVKNNKTDHPAVFPIQLAQDHIKTWSNEKDLILDPFMGSGTTGIACKNLNRKFIGIEIDKTYFNISSKRIEEILI